MEVKSLLIDTNAYVAFKRGSAEAVSILQNAPSIAINAVVLGELLSGFAVGTRRETNLRELARFLESSRVVVLPLDRRTAECYAAVYEGCKKAATPIPTNDMWIAATAIQHNLAIFSYDGHFRVVPHLQAGNSLSELNA